MPHNCEPTLEQLHDDEYRVFRMGPYAPDIHAPAVAPRCDLPVIDWAKVGRELDCE